MLAQNGPATRLLVTYVASPLGKLTLLADEKAICGLYLPTQAASVQSIVNSAVFTLPKSLPIFDSASAFLEAYFAKQPLPELPSMNLRGTAFQVLAWDELCKIPAGETCSYSEIAEAMGRPTATRAVGKAIGDNPISILVPCHRVIGRSGALTGYAGGLDNKRWLLAHEGALLIV